MDTFEGGTGDGEYVSPTREREIRELGEKVRRCLAAAGLPATVRNDYSSFVGADIMLHFDIIPRTGELGGVYVSWSATDEIDLAAALAVEAFRPADPMVKYSGAIGRAMCDAMLAILASAGFAVKEAEGEYHPVTVKVLSGPDAS
ncbi:hypothetical protein [Kineosporia babensis]|uniref:Uncharacterized protein n=1 Tax=Kineosporia babensis TaxID=499548 RepID=A0A9X1NGW0_9ACTN|nr:hypothetical protein [Kineosporia babensis]MCD5314812.1 hypothetical protein [Kineosporia babensis]